MGRRPCCAKEGLNRGAWTAMEDKILTDYIKLHGEGKWRNLPIKAGLKRCGKSCRLRWLNYLKPDIKRGNITRDEEDLIIRLHNLLGNRWSLIAGRLPGRTDNEIKNYWNTNIGKRSTITTTTATTHHQHEHEQHHIHNDRRRQSSSPTRRRSTGSKLSQQRHHKKKKKTVNIPGSKNTTPIMPAVPIPIAIPSNVVRTKATRCTKVFINSHHNNSQQILDPLKMTSSSAPNFLNHNNNHHSTTASPQNDIIINHTAAATTTTNDHVQSVTHHTPEKPQPTWPTNDLMMDLEITDAFLTNDVMDTNATPPADDFSSFHRLNYTLTNHDHILHQQHGPHHHNTNNNKNVDNQDRYNSSSSLSFDDQGLFLKEDDDMMTTIMQAAAELDTNNNWFATFLGGGDIDFDDPLYSERGEPDVM